MAIDFTLTDEQRKLQLEARDFAENVLAPVVREADAEPDPLRAFQMTKAAYVDAYKRGIAFCMLPAEYGGGGLSNVDVIIAAEEICAVDPGFACTVLVNGLGLMPVWYWGTEEQKDRFLRAATSDPTGEYLVGYAVSEPAGTPGGTANFDTPLPHPVGIGVTAELDGDEYVLNGRKYWPCNVAGWDGQGANVSLVVVRTDSEKGGTEGLSAIMVERGTPGVSYKLISKIGHRLTPNAEIIFENARVPAANLVEGTRGNGDLLINRNFAWSGPVAGIAAVGVARAAYEAALDYAKTYTAGGPKPDHPLPERRLRPRRRRRADRGVPVLLLEDRALHRPARLPRRADRRDVQDPLHRAALRRRVQVHAGRRRQQRRQTAHVREVPARGDDPAALRRRQLRHAAPARPRRARAPRASTRGRSWTTSSSSSPRTWRRSTPFRRTRSWARASDRRQRFGAAARRRGRAAARGASQAGRGG